MVQDTQKQQNINIQLNELDGFLRSAEHINKLMDNFNNLDTVDENDLYDLMYIRKSIEKQLEKDISNKDIKQNLINILNKTDSIISLLNDKEVQRIQNNAIKNTNKLDKVKYGDKRKLKGLKDLTHKVKGNIDLKKALTKYILTRVGTGIILTILIVLNTDDILKSIGNHWDSLLAQEQSIEVEQQIDVEEQIDKLTVKPNEEVIDDMNKATKSIITVIDILFTLMFMLYISTFTLDIFYITMGYDLEKYKGNNLFSEGLKLISNGAIDILKQLEDEENYENIDTERRIVVAETLMDNLIFSLDKQIREMEVKKLDAKDLKDILSKLDKLKNDSIVKRGLGKIEALAEGEIIYWQNRDTIHLENELE